MYARIIIIIIYLFIDLVLYCCKMSEFVYRLSNTCTRG